MTETEKWLHDVSSGDSDRQVAIRAGIPQGTLSRQLRNDLLTPENVVAIARAYKASALDGLVAIGLIQRADVVSMSARDALLSASDEDLVGEVLRRIQTGSASAALTEPATATVHAFPSREERSGTTVSESTFIAAMEDYDGEDLVAEMEGHEEQP